MKKTKILKILGIVFVILILLMMLSWLILPRFYSEDESSSWTYTSKNLGISLTLPSSRWQEIDKNGMDVKFSNAQHKVAIGFRIQNDAPREKFAEVHRKMKVLMEENPEGKLEHFSYQEGKTNSGYQYSLWHGVEADSSPKSVFVAIGLAWHEEKQMLIDMILEGQVKMQSKHGKDLELDYMVKSAKSIFLSLR